MPLKPFFHLTRWMLVEVIYRSNVEVHDTKFQWVTMVAEVMAVGGVFVNISGVYEMTSQARA